MRQPLSCIFQYKKRLFVKTSDGFRPATNKDGSFKENDNFLSFLQVISAYWEVIDEESGKCVLNIFMNGGSISRDRETGAAQMKAGYTVVLPQFLGEPFMDQFYNWSCAFGLSSVPAPSFERDVRHEPRPRNSGERGSRQLREEEFVPPDSDTTEARFEPAE